VTSYRQSRSPYPLTDAVVPLALVLGDQVGREGWLALSPPGARRALRYTRGLRPFRCELCLSRPLAGVLLASCYTPTCSAPGSAPYSSGEQMSPRQPGPSWLAVRTEGEEVSDTAAPQIGDTRPAPEDSDAEQEPPDAIRQLREAYERVQARNAKLESLAEETPHCDASSGWLMPASTPRPCSARR
jgi:hypothetical protein